MGECWVTYQNHEQFRGASGKADQRRPRASTFLGAQLQWAGTERPVQVRDLSETGALVMIDRPPSVGTPVLLIRGDHRLHADVVWGGEGKCGVRFGQAVAVQEVIKGTRPQPKPFARGADTGRPTELLDELCERADRLALALAEQGAGFENMRGQALEIAHLLRRLRV